MSRERQEPNRFGETAADRHRRAVQAADRLRAQLQTTMQAAVEADEDVPAEVSEAMLVLVPGYSALLGNRPMLGGERPTSLSRTGFPTRVP
jgi:hypothetical protein